jgi:MFS family permease
MQDTVLGNEVAPPPSLWRNRDYMLLWGGQAISSLGSSASGVVFPLLVLEITRSPAIAGIMGALFSIPYLIFSLPVGALIDRWDRKRVMMLCDGARALNLASVPLAMLFNALTVWQLFANAFIEGSLFVFFSISESAALPRVVPKTQLPASQLPEPCGRHHGIPDRAELWHFSLRCSQQDGSLPR